MITKDDVKLIKEELKDTFSTKEDLNRFATKEDLNRFATKEDLKKLATKKDLDGFVTKKDLKNELKKYATKRDLNKMEKRIIGAVSNISVNSPTINQFNELEGRVTRLETSVN